jgi:GTPase involved in cell partitioning and DNA repair
MIGDFLHHLHDTLVLLGLDPQLAKLLNNPSDITQASVDELRNLNCRMIGATKDRLVALNKIDIGTERGQSGLPTGSFYVGRN